MTELLTVTQIGRRVATSGLCPEAAFYFLKTIPQMWARIAPLLPPQHEEPSAGPSVAEVFDASDLAFVLFHMALASPEFERTSPPPPRISLYQLDQRRESDRAVRLQSALTVSPWDRNVFAVNGASLAVDWINGTSLRDLEGRFPELRGGSLTGLFRDLGQILAGIAEVILAATASTLPTEERRPELVSDPQSRLSFRRLVSLMRRLCVRLERGLPDEVVWMTELRASNSGGRLVSNKVAMALFAAQIASPDAVLDRGRTSDMILALRSVVPAADGYVSTIRSAVAEWRRAHSRALCDRQVELLPDVCKPVVRRFYGARGVPLEDCLNAILACVRIEVHERDAPSKTAFPDFVLNVLGPKDVVIECKSKDADDGEVTFNDATDVLRKAHVHGLRDAHKVTLCQPMLSPDVVRKIDQCAELTVVNVDDLAEGLVRLYRQRILQEDFMNWLTTPGQAKRESLPFRSARA